MPTNRPSMKELVEAVREFLENKVQPAIEGQVSFHTRIAINMLKTVERELELSPELDSQELLRLQGLLGKEGSLEELNSELCRKIREESLDYQSDDLIEHLRLTALGKLSIDNPGYSAYQRVVGETEGE
ncbi:MAG: hypothetical protein GY866_15935 [Proteobacteria bacterium]|nr:hypothetical protein [Pseudomonadota bacterium]